MAIFMVQAESLDWCGCESDWYWVEAKDSLDAEYKAGNAGYLEDYVREFYDAEEGDEDYIADEDMAIGINVKEYNEKEFGELTLYQEL